MQYLDFLYRRVAIYVIKLPYLLQYAIRLYVIVFAIYIYIYVFNVNLLQTNSVCISMCVFIVCMYLLYVLHV